MEKKKSFVAQKEMYLGVYRDLAGFDTLDEAYMYICEDFDASSGYDDYRIQETDSGCTWPLPGYKLWIEECPVCGGQVRRIDLLRTYDCHGIPYRHVCQKCYDKIMEEKGYDGELYDETDENLDYDY